MEISQKRFWRFWFSRTKIVSKQGCVALMSKNGPFRPMQARGVGRSGFFWLGGPQHNAPTHFPDFFFAWVQSGWFLLLKEMTFQCNCYTYFQPLSSPTEKPTLTTSVGNRIWWKCLGTTGSAPWFGPSPPQSFRTMASTGTRQRPGSKRVPKTDEVCVGIIQRTLALVK